MANLGYYCPTIGINGKELYDVVRNRISPEEWEREGFRLIYDNSKDGYCCYQFASGERSVNIRFAALDNYSPIMIFSSVKRNRERVALKLARILKMGDLEKVDEATVGLKWYKIKVKRGWFKQLA